VIPTRKVISVDWSDVEIGYVVRIKVTCASMLVVLVATMSGLGMFVYAACIYFFILGVLFMAGVRLCKSMCRVLHEDVFARSATTRSVPRVGPGSRTKPVGNGSDTESSSEDDSSDTDTDVDVDMQHDAAQAPVEELVLPTSEIFPVVLRPSAYKCVDE